MEDELVVRSQVKVTPEDGLHLRPIMAIVRKATMFSSSVFLSFDGRRADGKSTLDLMMLAAPRGAVLNLEATGEDARAASDAIRELFEQGFVVSDPGNV
jgi:phosphocarrier protein HPr